MQELVIGLMSVVMLLNSIVWLGISILLLYNLYQYTKDRINIKKLIHPFFKKFL